MMRELLRWRDPVGELLCSDAPELDAHRAAFPALLQLHPTTAKQIPFVLGG